MKQCEKKSKRRKSTCPGDKSGIQKYVNRLKATYNQRVGGRHQVTRHPSRNKTFERMKIHRKSRRRLAKVPRKLFLENQAGVVYYPQPKRDPISEPSQGVKDFKNEMKGKKKTWEGTQGRGSGILENQQDTEGPRTTPSKRQVLNRTPHQTKHCKTPTQRNNNEKTNRPTVSRVHCAGINGRKEGKTAGGPDNLRKKTAAGRWRHPENRPKNRVKPRSQTP